VLSNGLEKREAGWELLITTAGVDRSSLLGRLYEKGRRIETGEIENDSFLFDWLEAPADLDVTDPVQRAQAVRFCHPDPDRFTSHERVLRRFNEIPVFEFERYYLNRWSAADTAWLPVGAWEACEDPTAVIPDGASVVLGVDIGTKRDTSAVVRRWKRDDDRVVVEAEVFRPGG
jgi:phage terminase large subunit-like protein